MTSAVEMATSSFNKLGDWLKITTEATKDVQTVRKSEPNTAESISSFRSQFSFLRQSFNERGHRLSAFKGDLKKAFSSSNLPTNIFERVTTTPLRRRANTDNERTQARPKTKDFYTRHSVSASASPSVELKMSQNSSPSESCLNKSQIDVIDLRHISDNNSGNKSKRVQQQKYVIDHNESIEFKTGNKDCTGKLQHNNEADLAEQDTNSVATNPAILKDRYDARTMSDGSFSETNSAGATATHEVVRKYLSSRSYRQRSNENDFQEENLNNYERQDSGFYSEEESRKFGIKGRYKVEDLGADGYDSRKEETVDPYQMISHILNIERSETQSHRDPYRIIQRPSQKKMKSSICRSLGLGDRMPLKRFEQERQANDMCNNKEPKLKLSIQTFTSSKQMRVIVTEIAQIDELHSKTSKSEHSIRLRLTIAKMHHNICRKFKSSDLGDLREVFYFFDIDFDKLQNAELRIRLYDKQRYAVLFCRFPVIVRYTLGS